MDWYVANIHPADWRRHVLKTDTIWSFWNSGGYGGAAHCYWRGRTRRSEGRALVDLARPSGRRVPECRLHRLENSLLYIAALRRDEGRPKVWRRWRPHDIHVDFAAVTERMRRVQARVSRRRSAQELSSKGIDVFFGEGRFAGHETIAVNGTRLRFKRALIAVNARPLIVTFWHGRRRFSDERKRCPELTECPQKLIGNRRWSVRGRSPNWRRRFPRLGSRVSIVRKDEAIFLIGQEERDAAQILSDALARDGIDIHLNTQIASVHTRGAQKLVELVSDDYKTNHHAVDAILSVPSNT